MTAEDVMQAPPGGEVLAAPGAIVTPWAREVAATRGVRISVGAACYPTHAVDAESLRKKALTHPVVNWRGGPHTETRH